MRLTNRAALYWTRLCVDNWNIYLAATDKGLCYVGSHDKSFDELSAWANQRYPRYPFIENREKLQRYVEELARYLQGGLQSFSAPIDVKGTSFQQSVWKALCEIPYGQTCTYSDIALRIHKPAAVRAVGAAIGANPLLIVVPCHRVTGKNGALTGYRGGLDMKARLLKLESEF
ncbi:methylated-DNA--[protein]-cysteine S-methyltransferase [Paenibacillus lentus]|uniref:Methylated-DNA--protein-cysteine methyltransferase n=1 Tax=Paenibacillus lentus TaxID=1338368 RepID=A0A3Q8SCB4_9BACL|nr:methylated-DNA--[protein]-cysteine S-methyltransferase [Paenibacillus lentus]AZK47439.1 methylated-DNA--[protein]-cysteine S-methyltransferase [Paenibacillus lentus]